MGVEEFQHDKVDKSGFFGHVDRDGMSNLGVHTQVCEVPHGTGQTMGQGLSPCSGTLRHSRT